MIPADKKAQRMLEVAHLYYEENRSQQEIARQLGISRPLVSVILNEARECGIVTITIKDISVTEEQIIDKLKKSYGITSVILVPNKGNDDLTNMQVAETGSVAGCHRVIPESTAFWISPHRRAKL